MAKGCQCYCQSRARTVNEVGGIGGSSSLTLAQLTTAVKERG